MQEGPILRILARISLGDTYAGIVNKRIGPGLREEKFWSRSYMPPGGARYELTIILKLKRRRERNRAQDHCGD